MELRTLVDIDDALLGPINDDELVRQLANRKIEGLVTCDDNMIFRPEVLEAVADTGFSIVTCKRTGHDPVRASGLLLVHLPYVAKRHRAGQPQIWRLGTAESRPLDFAEHRSAVWRRSES